MSKNPTIEEAVLRFTESYKTHFIKGAPDYARDPRSCRACQKAFDDLILVCNRLDTLPDSSVQESGNVINLFAKKNTMGLKIVGKD